MKPNSNFLITEKLKPGIVYRDFGVNNPDDVFLPNKVRVKAFFPANYIILRTNFDLNFEQNIFKIGLKIAYSK